MDKKFADHQSREGQKNFKQLQRRKKFDSKYGELNDHQLLQESLYTQQEQLRKLDTIKDNSNIMLWCLFIIPIIVVFLYVLMEFGMVS